MAQFVGADRGLKRLSVTTVEPDDLEQPPVVRLDEPAGAAAARLRAEGARWAVVLNEEGELHGWVGAEELSLAGAGSVADLARRMEAWVPVGAPLKQAFSEMLQYDAGWVAVLDGARFRRRPDPGEAARGAAAVGGRGCAGGGAGGGRFRLVADPP